jgi:hypothetical protein
MNNATLDDQEGRAALERAVELEEEEDLDQSPRSDCVAPQPGTTAFSVEEMEAIGAQAGIEARFVRAAIAEARAGLRGQRASQLVEWLAGTDRRALVRRKHLHASATQVSEALAAVATRMPFELSVVEADASPKGDVELVLEVPAACWRSETARALVGAGVRHVQVSIRSDSTSTTEIVARGDWRGVGRHARASATMFGILGLAVGWIAGKALAHSWMAGSGALAALHALLVFPVTVAVCALAGVALARTVTRCSVEYAGAGVARVLEAVDLDVRTRGRFRF